MHCRCCARSECQRCCRWSGTCVGHRGRRQQGRLRVALLPSPRRRAHKQPSLACHSSRDRRFKRRDAVAAGGGVGGALPLAAAARAAAASFRACVRVLSLPCRAIVSTLKEGARAGPGPAPRKTQHGASRRRNAPPAQPAPRRQNQYASLHAEPSSASATLQWSSCLRICPSESKCSSMNTLRAQAFRSGGGTRGRAHAARPVAEGRRLGQPATPNTPPPCPRAASSHPVNKSCRAFLSNGSSHDLPAKVGRLAHLRRIAHPVSQPSASSGRRATSSSRTACGGVAHAASAAEKLKGVPPASPSSGWASPTTDVARLLVPDCAGNPAGFDGLRVSGDAAAVPDTAGSVSWRIVTSGTRVAVDVTAPRRNTSSCDNQRTATASAPARPNIQRRSQNWSTMSLRPDTATRGSTNHASGAYRRATAASKACGVVKRHGLYSAASCWQCRSCSVRDWNGCMALAAIPRGPWRRPTGKAVAARSEALRGLGAVWSRKRLGGQVSCNGRMVTRHMLLDLERVSLALLRPPPPTPIHPHSQV